MYICLSNVLFILFRIEKLIGYDSENLEKESIYNYHHALDSENLEKCYKQCKWRFKQF